MRIYFCSDIHASEKCWHKFLKTPEYYGADVIIVGGDITGKFIVPIVEQPDGSHVAKFLGVDRRASSKEELERLRRMIADNGSYGWVCTPDEREWHEADQSRVDDLFKKLIRERVLEWVEMADRQLEGKGIRTFVSGANDDFFEVDDWLAESEVIEDPNGKVVELDEGLQLLGMGYGNPTPWPCPRDIPEEELKERIDRVAEKVRDPARAIFSLHVPPYRTGLDVAPRLDENLGMVMTAAGPEMIPVGSTAVRDAILEYRPMLGLHGHIHESKGVKRLGGVTITNPGSEYGEGILDGVLVDVDRKKGLRKVQLVTG